MAIQTLHFGLQFYFLFCHHLVLLALQILSFSMPKTICSPSIGKTTPSLWKASVSLSVSLILVWMNYTGNEYDFANMASNLSSITEAQLLLSQSWFQPPFLKNSSLNAAVMVLCTAQPSSHLGQNHGVRFELSKETVVWDPEQSCKKLTQEKCHKLFLNSVFLWCVRS